MQCNKHRHTVMNLEKSDNHATSFHVIKHAHSRHTCTRKKYRRFSRSRHTCVCRFGDSQQATFHCPITSSLLHASFSTGCPSTHTYNHSHIMCGSSAASAPLRCCTNTPGIYTTHTSRSERRRSGSEHPRTRALRMTKITFGKLLERLRPYLQLDPDQAQRSSSGPVYLDVRLALTLHMLAGASYLDVMLLLGLSRSAVYATFHATI